MVRVLCMYCQSLIQTVDRPEGEADITFHGVCHECLPRLLKEFGMPMTAFLDHLQAPVLVVGDNFRILAANAAAQALLGKTECQVSGRLAGDVIGCALAALPGGCGKTLHCQSCAIRRTVTHTMQTGEPCRNVPAFADIGVLTKCERVEFRIETEKRNDVVLLRIDEKEGAAADATSEGLQENASETRKESL